MTEKNEKQTKNTESSIARWKVGHRLFFVLLQGQVIALRRFEDALKTNNLESASENLEKATLLMLASSAAFRFCGDFSEQEYEEIVRPSMSPPKVGEGFSGLLSSDHLKLIEVMKQMRQKLTNLPESLKEQHRRFKSALNAAYEAHIYVCGRFKGGEQPSLRMSETTEKTAVEILEGLRRSRGKLLEMKRKEKDKKLQEETKDKTAA